MTPKQNGSSTSSGISHSAQSSSVTASSHLLEGPQSMELVTSTENPLLERKASAYADAVRNLNFARECGWWSALQGDSTVSYLWMWEYLIFIDVECFNAEFYWEISKGLHPSCMGFLTGQTAAAFLFVYCHLLPWSLLIWNSLSWIFEGVLSINFIYVNFFCVSSSRFLKCSKFKLTNVYLN